MLHALAGLAVLVLTGVRIVWRLVTPAPPYPAAMPGWQRWTARAMALAFYALMLLMPVTGWISHSLEYAGAFGAGSGLDVFGYVTIPAFPGWQHFPPNTLKELHAAFTHFWIPLLGAARGGSALASFPRPRRCPGAHAAVRTGHHPRLISATSSIINWAFRLPPQSSSASRPATCTGLPRSLRR